MFVSEEQVSMSCLALGGGKPSVEGQVGVLGYLVVKLRHSFLERFVLIDR